MNRTKIFICAATLVALCAPAAMAVPFSNGSFESPVITYPAYQVTSDTVWTLSSAQIMSSASLTIYGGGGLTTTDQGTQFAVLNSNGSAGSISQTFDTIIGGQYSVSFAQNQFYTNNGSSPPQPTSVNLTATAPGYSGNFVYNRGTLPGSFVTDALWDHHSFTFTATGTSSTLSFIGNSTSGANYGQAIDNVIVAFIPPPVPAPEPASIALLGVGMLGLVTLRRRQRAVS